MMRNVEVAFARARRFRLRARTLGVVLRHHDFLHDGLEVQLNRGTSSEIEVLPLIREMFGRIFREGSRYRSTLVALGRMESDATEQGDLFEDLLKIENWRRAEVAIDAVNRACGSHTIAAATTLSLDRQALCPRDQPPERRLKTLMPGETSRKRLGIPRMNVKV